MIDIIFWLYLLGAVTTFFLNIPRIAFIEQSWAKEIPPAITIAACVIVGAVWPGFWLAVVIGRKLEVGK